MFLTLNRMCILSVVFCVLNTCAQWFTEREGCFYFKEYKLSSLDLCIVSDFGMLPAVSIEYNLLESSINSRCNNSNNNSNDISQQPEEASSRCNNNSKKFSLSNPFINKINKLALVIYNNINAVLKRVQAKKLLKLKRVQAKLNQEKKVLESVIRKFQEGKKLETEDVRKIQEIKNFTITVKRTFCALVEKSDANLPYLFNDCAYLAMIEHIVSFNLLDTVTSAPADTDTALAPVTSAPAKKKAEKDKFYEKLEQYISHLHLQFPSAGEHHLQRYFSYPALSESNQSQPILGDFSVVIKKTDISAAGCTDKIQYGTLYIDGEEYCKIAMIDFILAYFDKEKISIFSCSCKLVFKKENSFFEKKERSVNDILRVMKTGL